MIRHHPANTVTSPKDCVDNVRVIYDGGAVKGEFSVAVLEWQGNPCIGIRWNITERELYNPDKQSGKVICVGEPNSRGYATWFILPDSFLTELLQGGNISREIKKYLGEAGI